MMNENALGIGVTGHRKLDEGKIPELEYLIQQAINNIIYYYKSTHDSQPVVTYTSLVAAGADTLFANVVINHFTSDLKIYLPFEKEEYLNDFDDKGKSEFNALLENQRVSEVTILNTVKNNDRDDLYLRAGKKVVDNNDYIIAVWNEKPANGKGGTADIVEYALIKNKTILLINPEEAELRIKILPEIHGTITNKLPAAEPGVNVVDSYYNFYDSAAISDEKTYRNIWQWTFVLGWVAASIIALKIVLKLSAVGSIDSFNPDNLQFYLSVTEILLLITIFIIITVERIESYHSQYLKNRFFAETFRINRLIFYCGLYPNKTERKVIHKALENYDMRDPVIEVNKIIILSAYSKASLEHKKGLLKNFTTGQFNYHIDRGRRLLKTDKLNKVGKYACFAAFLLILVYHAIHDFYSSSLCHTCSTISSNNFWTKWAEPVSIFFYLFLPVTIGRLEATKYLYDWEKLIVQSKYMSEFFKSTTDDIDKISTDAELDDIIKKLNENMYWENMDWEMFMKDKNEFSY